MCACMHAHQQQQCSCPCAQTLAVFTPWARCHPNPVNTSAVTTPSPAGTSTWLSTAYWCQQSDLPSKGHLCPRGLHSPAAHDPLALSWVQRTRTTVQHTHCTPASAPTFTSTTGCFVQPSGLTTTESRRHVEGSRCVAPSGCIRPT